MAILSSPNRVPPLRRVAGVLWKVTLVAAIFLLELSPSLTPVVEASPIRRAVSRGAARSVGRSAERALARALRLDRWRDARLPLRRLSESRTVFRYVNPAALRQAVRSGFPARTHFTSGATRGRPLTAEHAAARFGITKPTHRITAVLPQGTKVRFGKSLHGERGVGELSLGQRLAKNAIRRVVRLRQGPRW